MKKFISFLLAVILTFSLFSCGGNEEESEIKLLAGKTPAEVYAGAIQFIKSLTNYEIVLESVYKTTHNGVQEEEIATSIYKSSGDSFYYEYKAPGEEEFFLHDGNKLYKNYNGEKEQIDISYAEFTTQWGSVIDNGMLIELPEEKLAKEIFIRDGDAYKLEIIISIDEYNELTGSSIIEPAVYEVWFDASGIVTGFSRVMKYFYDEDATVVDEITVEIKNIGIVEKISAPADVDSYRIPVKAEDIDLSSITDISKFIPCEEATDYVMLTFKTDAKVTLSEDNTADGYEATLLIRLFPNVAPRTVAAFKSLVSKSFYNGNIIDYIANVANSYSVMQFGPKEESAEGEATETEKNEELYVYGEFYENGFTNNLSHKKGVLSAMRTNGYETIMSYLFMCRTDSPDIDGNYAPFGYIVYGIDQLDILASVELDSEGKPTTDIVLTSISFVKENA